MNKDTWFAVAEQIDDPVTFRNFGLVCKMFAVISIRLNPQKKTQFSKKVTNLILARYPCCRLDEEIGYKLPNGNWHGKYIYNDNSLQILFVKIFENGLLLSEEIITNESIDNEYT